ncbi:MAG: undecaprenyl-diphosphate phosphatase [Candidatus Ratteibacteria bacterium]|nr:undecaprenyl-diphosphate phosphatase [Candidatus Ratteibacteria bacterium]
MREAFILGLVQGIAEWLPISSSGHLVVFQHLFGLKGGVSFDIFLHLSSLLVIIIFFRRDIVKVGRALFFFDRKSYEFNIGLYIIYGSIVTGVIGIFLSYYIERFAIMKVMPFTFLITSVLLFLSTRKSSGELDTKKALFIGLMQGLSLLPGVSRSGATISAAKIAGVKNEEAFRFSFLLAIPAILGAVILEVKEFQAIPVSYLLTGLFTSFFVGMISLYLLKNIVVKDKIYLFGFYTLTVAIVVAVL